MKPMMRLRLLCKEGMNACNRGDFDNALFQLHMALRLVLHEGHPLMEAKVRNNMALVLRIKGDHAEAMDQLCQAHDVTVGAVGTDNILYRNITKNIDEVSRELGIDSPMDQASPSSTKRESERRVCALSAAVSSQPKRSAGTASNFAT